MSSTSSSPCISATKPCSPDTPLNTTCLEPDVMVYDHEGAMKFTVVVVLVYGIGIIGLLGVYSQKKRTVEDKIKEGGTFAKTFDEKRYLLEKKARKSAITKLVYSIHEPDFTGAGPGRVITNPLFMNFGILERNTELGSRDPQVQADAQVSYIPETNDIEFPEINIHRTDPNYLSNELTIIQQSDNETPAPSEPEYQFTGSQNNTPNRTTTKEFAATPETPETAELRNVVIGDKNKEESTGCNHTTQGTKSTNIVSKQTSDNVCTHVTYDRRNAIIAASRVTYDHRIKDIV